MYNLKHFTEAPATAAEIETLMALADKHKRNPYKHRELGKDKTLGLVFFNPSLRTRLSSQLAAQQLGMHSIVFNIDKEGWALEFKDEVIMDGTSVEHVRDAAPILGQYFDLIGIRTFPGLQDRNSDYAETVLNQFIAHCGVPIVSLESATLHPLQSLADCLTIRENWSAKTKPKVVLAWGPHIKPLPQCVANSFAQWMMRWGAVDLTIAHPEGYELAKQYTTGATITHNLTEAVEDADFIYVKNWSSYTDYGKILTKDPAWMLTQERLTDNPKAKIMHCLPVRRNLEISGALLDSLRSLVPEQAANRTWAMQAVLSQLLS